MGVELLARFCHYERAEGDKTLQKRERTAWSVFVSFLKNDTKTGHAQTQKKASKLLTFFGLF
jgi:hypothetical protein